MWLDKLLRDISGDAPQVINDSKTPSGRVHVGSLRGVLIHDAVARALQERGASARFIYGVDDYDPMDGLPADASDELREQMGKPLCAVAGEPNLATQYITEFLDLFEPLGVSADIYYTSAMYRQGDFNEAIEAFLDAANTVREIYARVSGNRRAADWFPFQTVCERCGKIGTTRVTHWDGKEVTYRCEPQLVEWASGCGYEGKVSPFDGRGKLPWKLEWPAKWQRFGVTIEGAGKDHCTKGGSRDVAVALARRVLNIEPPLNIPYEFFLVDGSKMSSSRGIGAAARDIADFLPPDMLRFLMLRSPPHKTVNFSTHADYTARLFNEYDELAQGASSDKAAEKKQLLRLASATNEPPTLALPPFQLLTALAQLPHIDLEAEIERRFPDTYTEADREQLSARIRAARYWLERFAGDENIALCAELPKAATNLSATQKAFLHLLAERMSARENENQNDESALQSFIFDVARATPLPPKKAFEAIYRVLFNSPHGPRAGALLAWLDSDFLLKRFTEVTFAVRDWWDDTAVSSDEALKRLDEADAERVVKIDLRCDDETGLRVLNLLAARRDQKQFVTRVRLKARNDDDALHESADLLAAIRVRYPQTPDDVTREDALLK